MSQQEETQMSLMGDEHNDRVNDEVVEEVSDLKFDTTELAILNQACADGDMKKVQLKISQDAMLLNAGDYDKRTPLHVAVANGKVDIVEFLLNKTGINPNPVDVFGRTPLDEAVKIKSKKLVSLLREQKARHGNNDLQTTLLMNAVARNDLEEVKQTLHAAQNSDLVNCKDYDSRTPLHIAVANRNEAMCKLLIQTHNANPNAKDRWGQTPKDDAANIHLRTGVSKIRDLFGSQVEEDHEHQHEGWNSFVLVFGLIEIVMIILFATLADYDLGAEADKAAGLESDPDFVYLSDVYGWFMDIHVMIFIGFGFLMTFLRKYNFSAVGLTFLIGAYCIQLHILVEHALYPILNDPHGLHVNVVSLILGDFCAGAVLITYGVLLGKVSPMQLLCIATIEVFVFTMNELIGINMGITDVGGSMVVHMFGAFFGIAVSVAMSKNWMGKQELSRNCSVYNSDTFAMIGTVFLWMFWPSFNVCLAADDEARHMGIVNTVLALCGSCVVAFLASNFFRGERAFDMVDIQNATLAGGVAMGTSADLNVNPGLAILIGGLGGFVSVVGYVFIQPVLEDKISLHDTCGVNNLHGMPSIVGAVTGVIILTATGNEDYDPTTNLGFMFITLVISIGGGIITGVIVNFTVAPVPAERLFEDQQYWEVPGSETPYYFDKRGELQREDDPALKDAAGKQLQDMALLKDRLDVFERNLQFFKGQLRATAQRSGDFDAGALEGMFRRLLQSSN